VGADEIDHLGHPERGRETRLLRRRAQEPPRLHLARVAPEDASPTFVRRPQSEQDQERRGLAGAVRAEQGDDLADPHSEAEALQRLDLSVALADALEHRGDLGAGRRRERHRRRQRRTSAFGSISSAVGSLNSALTSFGRRSAAGTRRA
jgi:hypothetical protein